MNSYYAYGVAINTILKYKGGQFFLDKYRV